MAYPNHYIKSGASDLYDPTEISSENKTEGNIQIPYIVLYTVFGIIGGIFVLLILKFLFDKCKNSKGNSTSTYTSTSTSREQLNENQQLQKLKLTNSETIYKTSSLKKIPEFEDSENSENSSEKSDDFSTPPISTATFPIQPKNSDLILQDLDFSEELPLNWGSFGEKTLDEYQKLVDKYKSTTSVDSGIFASVNYELQQPSSSNLPGLKAQNSVNNRVRPTFGPRKSSFEAYTLNRKFSTMMTPEEAEEAIKFKSTYYQITPGDLKRLESMDDD